jgi:hypothetical protein
MTNEADEVEAITHELCKSDIVLTYALLGLLERDAQHENRSPSYIAREIIGKHYGLPQEFRNPPRKKRKRKEVNVNG